jgi:mandelate racemase
MAASGLTITAVTARAVVAPLERPVRTAVGTVPAAPLVLIDVRTAEGVVGRAYLFGYTPVTLAPLVSLIESIGEEIKGQPIAPVARQAALDRRFRLLGWQGLVGMAVSGLDMAFWDALGHAAGWPVARLLGGEARPLPAYDSYGVVDPTADEAAIRRSIERGFKAIKIKIKIGDGDLRRDIDTVRAVRSFVGADIALMVDYNQSLDPAEACRRIARLAEFDPHWVEEPVAAEDLAGHARVRAATGARVQTGENWWFPRDMQKAISAGASDFAMLDIIGGVTGWLRAAGQAEAASLPVSSHIFVEASAHALAVTPTAHWIEHLDIARAILAEPCEVVDGAISAKGAGLGIAWDEAAVTRYAV